MATMLFLQHWKKGGQVPAAKLIGHIDRSLKN